MVRLCILLALLFSVDVYAKYPEKPVRFIVPFRAGGSTDIAARILAKHLQDETKINYIIQNKPGAGNLTGTEYASKSTPDGYTLLVVATSFAITPALVEKMPYDPVRDFIPISQIVELSNVVVVFPKSNIQTLSDLTKRKITVGHSGIATSSHLAIELLISMGKNKFDFLLVPYSGGSHALQAVLTQDVDINFASLSSAIPLIKNNQLRAIATTSSSRINRLPDIPTVSESGFPQFRDTSWVGMLAPRNTPSHIINDISQLVNKILMSDLIKEQFSKYEMEVTNLSRAEFARKIANEIKKYKILVKERNIKYEF
jgi:tripartite-type tricarboxylate transporter receptor subunit TctC